MQEATPATVLGDFAAPPLVFERAGESRQARFSRAGEESFVRIEGPDGADQEYRVAYTFGVSPLQQYLVEFPGGILQCLPVAWDTRAGRWYHLDPTPPPGDAFHWTGRYQRWNMMCAECHSTELKKGYDPQSDTYTTTSVALDVGCQACHGSGAEHVERARGWRAGAAPVGSEARGFPSGLASHTPSLELETCAPCHSRRTALTEAWTPGAKFLDHFEPGLLRAGLYFPDGQILGEVYVWGSFTQSRMAAAGVVCSNCHDPHSLKLKLPEGPGHNELCVQCHSPAAPTERFPTLRAADYDTRAHHHHEPGSEAARCTTCHMPTRTYMGIDARRDHRMGVPRPDLSVELGGPNACATCHASADGEAEPRTAYDDASLSAAIAEWRSALPEGRAREAALARTLARARAGELVGAELTATVLDSDLSALQRATALELLGDTGELSREVLDSALVSEVDLVRVVAARLLLGARTGPEVATRLAQARADPLRAVRAAAGEATAVDERDARNDDFPATWFQAGVTALRAGDPTAAEAALRRTLAMDPDFTPAIHELAVLLSGTGRGAAARDLLVGALAAHPDDGELAYSLGLQQAELGEGEAAVASLLRAAELQPERSRLAYNLGLLFDSLGRPAEAAAQLRRALALETRQPGCAQRVDTAFALAGLLLRDGHPDDARAVARELAKTHAEAAAALLGELESTAAAEPR